MSGTDLCRRMTTTLAAVASLCFGAVTIVRAADGPAHAADEKIIREAAQQFSAAFAKGDAKAIAASWTDDGEYVNEDGQTTKGRAALEKAYQELFSANKIQKAEIQIDSLRFIGKDVAVEDGTFTTTYADGKPAIVNRYSALHVKEDGHWLMALVRDQPSEASEANLSDLGWLVGEWSAKAPAAELRFRYSWGEKEGFLENRFRIVAGGQTVATGVQIIAKDPDAGMIRSWMFDSRGGRAEGVWSKDGARWVIESTAFAADGEATTSTNLLSPLSKDAFTWQATGDEESPTAKMGPAPLKVVRVPAAK